MSNDIDDITPLLLPLVRKAADAGDVKAAAAVGVYLEASQPNADGQKSAERYLTKALAGNYQGSLRVARALANIREWQGRSTEAFMLHVLDQQGFPGIHQSCLGSGTPILAEWSFDKTIFKLPDGGTVTIASPSRSVNKVEFPKRYKPEQ